jgi:carboxyl-terminal processing protease
VTTHSFYRVAGGSTQLKGVVPDIDIPSVLDVLEIGEEFLPHAMGWTVVGMAQYRPVSDLAPLIPELRRDSEQRRVRDARFAVQETLIQRIKKRVAVADISLNLDDRMALAREERGMEKMQAEALGEDGVAATDPSMPAVVKDPARKNKENDIVLAETERILGDLIALKARKELAKHED